MKALHDYFLNGLRIAPDRDAWRVGSEHVTYRQAHHAAQSCAAALMHATDVRPCRVGVLANKNSAAYLGVLAGLYARAAVVPLNPSLPVSRLRDIVAAAGVTAVVTDAASWRLVDEIVPAGARVTVLVVDPTRLSEPDVTPTATACPAPDADSRADAEIDVDATAYVMFTSGSTGRPKGVPVTHASATAYFDLMARRYDFRPTDVFSQTFDLGFDCAIFDLFAAWNAGACVTPVPSVAFRNLPAAIDALGITVWYSAPSAIRLAQRSGSLGAGSLPGLRTSLFAGEAFRDDDARIWATAAPRSVVENLYGPTELTITIAGHRWSPHGPAEHRVNGIVSIGAVHPGHDVVLLGPDGRPTRDPVGELCVSGPQATAGYLDPRDDSDRFLDVGGRRFYRTGDRVRRGPDDTFAYLGRVDDQVQLHGERIELPELDAAVNRHDHVTGAATVLADDELVVYYTGAELAPLELATLLRTLVPASVVPRRYHHLDALPVNANGKIDRPALRSLATGATGGLLHAMLDDACARTPGATAVRDASGAWSYAELQAQSEAVARWLDAHGIGRGARLLVQLPNVREVVAILYGCARRGVAVVPLNPDVRPFVIESVVKDCSPAAAVTTETAVDAIGALGLATYTVDDVWSALPAVTDDPGEAGCASDVGTLIYTSGSTAAPKGVICPQERMSFAAHAIASQLGYRADDVVYCRTPLSFDYGLFQIFLSAIAGAELVLAAGPDLTLLREIREYGATVVPAVPSLSTMLVRLGARDREPTRLRLVTNTGAALAQSTIDELRSTFPSVQVARMYGITECKRVAIMPPAQEFERPESVGRPLPGTTVTIIGDDGLETAPGVVGQIVVDGPNVMAGYWNAPELTAKTYRIDPATGRHRLWTGDWGHVDDDGYLYFAGRRDDTFKRKGVRMSTVEIEAAATDVPGVRAAVALAPTTEHDLALWFVGTVPVEDVRRELALRLEPAKLPAVVRPLDELPVTLNGKPDRKHLAAALVELVATVPGAPA